MLFHEVFGSYYRVAEKALREAIRGTLTRRRLSELIQTYGYAESSLELPERILSEKAGLFNQNLHTPLTHLPQMPLTVTEKRWLAALQTDPRFGLFDLPKEELDGIEPLFDAKDFCYFDRYLDGDPYTDADYVVRFRTILSAIHQKQKLRIKYRGKQQSFITTCTPLRLEYSAKDDKFRLIAYTTRNRIFNLSKILSCSPEEEAAERISDWQEPEKKRLVLELTDRRGALERVLLHFSHLEKTVVRLEQERYQLTLYYDIGDETEMLIRILSFGSPVRVTEPPEMIEKIRERVENQFHIFSGNANTQ